MVVLQQGQTIRFGRRASPPTIYAIPNDALRDGDLAVFAGQPNRVMDDDPRPEGVPYDEWGRRDYASALAAVAVGSAPSGVSMRFTVPEGSGIDRLVQPVQIQLEGSSLSVRATPLQDHEGAAVGDRATDEGCSAGGSGTGALMVLAALALLRRRL